MIWPMERTVNITVKAKSAENIGGCSTNGESMVQVFESVAVNHLEILLDSGVVMQGRSRGLLCGALITNINASPVLISIIDPSDV